VTIGLDVFCSPDLPADVANATRVGEPGCETERELTGAAREVK